MDSCREVTSMVNRKHLRSKERGRTTPLRVSIPIRPPPLSLRSNETKFHIRSTFPVSVQAHSQVYRLRFVDLVYLVSSLAKVFAEYKLHRVDCWFIPQYTIKEKGLHTMAVVDEGVIDVDPSLIEFTYISSAPGSCTARCIDELRGSWFPTHPSNKNWSTTAEPKFHDGHIYLMIARQRDSNDKLYLSGSFVLDVHVSCRGLIPSNDQIRLESCT